MSAGKTSIPAEFRQVADIARSMIAQTGPFRKETLRQGMEALKTGGVRAKIPLIQQAVSQSQQATSRALSSTSEELAKRNIGGPFASRILAGQRQAGAETAARLPTMIAENVIQRTTPFALGTQGMGLGGLSQAGQASFASDAFNAQQFAKLMGDIRQSLQSSSMAAACLHPDSRIETPNGSVPVKDIRPGDEVWTKGEAGGRVPAKVVMQAQRYVGSGHIMLSLEAPGGTVCVTPMHPDEHGHPIGHSVRGPYVQGVTDYTCDIEVDGPTGVYYVNGLALGSTLDARFGRRAA